ncbi:PEP-CTERM sorting domain-containing protein [Rubritalea tangerina]|uniref:PEP-CTERM sorting domain-containing protein n=1 Tax=Rubritalea tangerina TaxID=430798 RepID=A0ABW4ZD31_9BACT
MKKVRPQKLEVLRSESKKKGLGLTTTLVALGAFTGAADAALTLHLNPVAKTLYATGTDTGVTGGTSWGAADITWQLLGTPDTYTYTDLSGLFTVSSGAVLSGTQANLFTGPNPSMVLVVNTDASGNAAVTIEGTSSTVSYAGAAAFEAAIEGLAGAAIAYAPANGGSGFSAISVVTVPEPTTTLLLGFGGVVTLLRRRR